MEQGNLLERQRSASNRHAYPGGIDIKNGRGKAGSTGPEYYCATK
ncbi:hypothetical protein ECRM12761_27615 (plasmid) [Escherichia coli O145:H28 str. RM12761]|nr:hypothetical protein ECRM13516_5466 [Escherichia coli O145:H28 str. RM13516]AHY68440.1 hypothetical protein ECRM12761_27615 [Escherichia coli O145:H28 str. RM12761]